MRIYLQLSLIDSSIVLTSCEGSLKVQGKELGHLTDRFRKRKKTTRIGD